ncbi:MAG: DUF4148 domain-containing protein [Comamonas sp.]|jgi:hypothetical protein|nr:DUF4148 domain-containing protein [Comamonas sp.]
MTIANRFTVAVALTLSALAAQAGGLDFTGDRYPAQEASQSTLTRAEVRAQVLDAIAKGEMLSQGESYLPLSAQKQTASTLTREQVRNETKSAAKAGQLDNYGA